MELLGQGICYIIQMYSYSACIAPLGDCPPLFNPGHSQTKDLKVSHLRRLLLNQKNRKSPKTIGIRLVGFSHSPTKLRKTKSSNDSPTPENPYKLAPCPLLKSSLPSTASPRLLLTSLLLPRCPSLPISRLSPPPMQTLRCTWASSTPPSLRPSSSRFST